MNDEFEDENTEETMQDKIIKAIIIVIVAGIFLAGLYDIISYLAMA